MQVSTTSAGIQAQTCGHKIGCRRLERDSRRPQSKQQLCGERQTEMRGIKCLELGVEDLPWPVLRGLMGSHTLE